MPSKTRVLPATFCLAVLILSLARCGGSSTPTSPTASGGAGAVVAGTVNRASGGAAAGLTVSVVGTSASAAVQGSGAFELSGVPAGSVQLRFKDATVDATTQLQNVTADERIQIQVNVSASTATIVAEERSTTAKVSLCHAEGNGTYHLIEVSVSAEPAHRAHGDAKIGEPVPADSTKTFNQDCRPSGASIRIKKATNGQDADDAPGPTITVGAAVSWEYVVTNTGTVALTGVAVTDDRGVRVTCPASTLAAGQSMTCTGSGTATAGQYVNVGTAAADWSGGKVTSTDRSHYFGQAPSEQEGPKVELCHRTGNGSFNLIEVSTSAEPAHRAHGDGKIGEAVPGNPGKVFGAGCAVR
jgi:hypothetical protein